MADKTKKGPAAPKAPKKVARTPAKPSAKRARPATARKADSKANAAPKPRDRARTKQGANLADLIDHPLVADLLAVGAMAAVAAIADHNVKTRTGESEAGSSKAVKAAGKAAATAIGKRLLTEVNAIRRVGTAKPVKPGSR